MREVFPTLCSPKNTSLNLRSGFPNSLEFDMIELAQCECGGGGGGAERCSGYGRDDGGR